MRRMVLVYMFANLLNVWLRQKAVEFSSLSAVCCFGCSIRQFSFPPTHSWKKNEHFSQVNVDNLL